MVIHAVTEGCCCCCLRVFFEVLHEIYLYYKTIRFFLEIFEDFTLAEGGNDNLRTHDNNLFLVAL